MSPPSAACWPTIPAAPRGQDGYIRDHVVSLRAVLDNGDAVSLSGKRPLRDAAMSGLTCTTSRPALGVLLDQNRELICKNPMTAFDRLGYRLTACWRISRSICLPVDRFGRDAGVFHGGDAADAAIAGGASDRARQFRESGAGHPGGSSAFCRPAHRHATCSIADCSAWRGLETDREARSPPMPRRCC